MASAYPRDRITPITVPSAGLTTATTAYTSGDMVGTQMQFRLGANDSGTGNSVGNLVQLIVIDKAKVITVGIELWLFSTAVTQAADNAPISYSDADMQNLIGIFPCTTIYQTALNTIAVLDATEERPVWCGANGLAYGSLVTRSANSFFGAATDLTVVLYYQPEV